MAFEPLTAVLDIGGKLIDRLFPDPKQKAEATIKLLELQQSGDLAIIAGQLELNKIEATSPDRFVSGWRPFVGWVCASALAIQLVVGPLFAWGSAALGHALTVPPLDVSLLTTMLIGMLGLGGMRTVEKLQGVASK
jgi:hypothetical protein